MQKEDGSISEWNEGNFKSLRLHEAQEMINCGKVNPLKLSIDNVSWNYEMWIAGIDILCGEGQAKYSNDELKIVLQIKELVELRKKIFPVKNIVKVHSIGNTQQQHIINKKNWEDLKVMIELYEHKTKSYNDTHGLSTRNKDDFEEGL